MKPDDNFGKMIADMDQGTESLKLMARPLHSFYTALVKQGFSREEALRLTQTWFRTALVMSAEAGK